MMDYYQILGVARNATESEIKTAYRKLAFESHPDRNPGNKTAAERFKQVQAAYETLIDVNLRARYNGPSYNYQPRRPQPQAKPKPKPQPQKSTFRQYGRDFRISDAPPPRVDLWGNPLSEEEKAAWVRNNVTHVVKTDKQVQKIMDGWKDSYAGHYESTGSPDIR